MSSAPLDFPARINELNLKYILFLQGLQETFKNDDLYKHLKYDIRDIKQNLEEDTESTLDILIDNFLPCLEQINEHNADYFIYQKEKIEKKNGKMYKNKLPLLGYKTLLKHILERGDKKVCFDVFDGILTFIKIFTNTDNNGIISFHPEFETYVKDSFDENKNFSKMVVVMENANTILGEVREEFVADESNTSSKKKKNKKSKSGTTIDEEEFMKSLENSKIGKMAKNISDKLNIQNNPILNDPFKLISTLTSGEGLSDPSISAMITSVMDEVKDALKTEGESQEDLMNDAKNMMKNMKNVGGVDFASLLGGAGGGGGFDMSKMMGMVQELMKDADKGATNKKDE